VCDQVSHPYQTTGKIIMLYISIFKFLESKLYCAVFSNKVYLNQVKMCDTDVLSASTDTPLSAPTRFCYYPRIPALKKNYLNEKAPSSECRTLIFSPIS
jgi:hypothetical protein